LDDFPDPDPAMGELLMEEDDFNDIDEKRKALKSASSSSSTGPVPAATDTGATSVAMAPEIHKGWTEASTDPLDVLEPAEEALKFKETLMKLRLKRMYELGYAKEGDRNKRGRRIDKYGHEIRYPSDRPFWMHPTAWNQMDDKQKAPELELFAQYLLDEEARAREALKVAEEGRGPLPRTLEEAVGATPPPKPKGPSMRASATVGTSSSGRLPAASAAKGKPGKGKSSLPSPHGPPKILGNNTSHTSPRAAKPEAKPEATSVAQGDSTAGKANSKNSKPIKAGSHENWLQNIEGILFEHLADMFPDTVGAVNPQHQIGVEHVPKQERIRQNMFGLIARSVGKKEMRSQPKAIEAMDVEWARLRKAGPKQKGAWREDLVENWYNVKARYNRLGKTVHVGDLLEVCVQKHDELPDTPENEKLKRFKGRVVYGGHRVRDQMGMAALFQELHSQPANVTAARATIFYGLLEGHYTEQADADMAYTQSEFKGTDTFVRLPRDRWPQWWIDQGYTDPVCPMELSLYGHPESGYYWEEHCDKHLQAQGFTSVEEWPGTYWHEEHRCMLIVYVDDFLMSGPEAGLAKCWKLIRENSKDKRGIVLQEDPGPPSLFLGCQIRLWEVPCAEAPGGGKFEGSNSIWKTRLKGQ
jgi:hypothetical protein